MSLTVAIEAMRKDAGKWQDVSSTLSAASGAAAGFTLTKKHLSFVSDDTGLLGTYEEIRATVQRLTSEGSQEHAALSSNLYKVANEYERSDDSATKQFQGVWDPKR